MTEPPETLIEIARKLLDRTKSGAIEWKQNSNNEAIFETTFGSHVAQIVSIDKDGNHPFRLVIWAKTTDKNAKFREIDRIQTGIPITTITRASWENVLADLWRIARRKSLRIDEQLKVALSELP